MEMDGLITEESIKRSRAYELVVKNRNLINGTSLGHLLKMSSKGVTEGILENGLVYFKSLAKTLGYQARIVPEVWKEERSECYQKVYQQYLREGKMSPTQSTLNVRKGVNRIIRERVWQEMSRDEQELMRATNVHLEIAQGG